MTEPSKEPDKKAPWQPVDKVALSLALSLGVLSNLILITTIIQILDHMTPELMLSENATQIIIAISGGLTGLLGAYIGGHHRRSRNRNRDDE